MNRQLMRSRRLLDAMADEELVTLSMLSSTLPPPGTKVLVGNGEVLSLYDGRVKVPVRIARAMLSEQHPQWLLEL